MTPKHIATVVLAFALLGSGCGKEADPDGAGGGGPAGSAGKSGGSGGSKTGGTGGGGNPGTGGAGGATATGGAGGGATGGSAGGGGAGGSTGGAGGSTGGAAGSAMGGNDGGSVDVISPDATGETGSGPIASGQGPVAPGRIVFSQDFERDMVGINPGPRGLPASRVQIVDDPLGLRGKVVRVIFEQGDNFRTSAGTEPRSWISNRPNGYEFPPGKKVSYAFGMHTDKTLMNYCFGQVISTGGPVWMLIGNGNGNLVVFCNACGDANTTHFQLEPKKWHDFRVDMDFRPGGAVQFFHNGVMFRQSRLANTRGTLAHWDGGIYNRKEGTGGPTRTVWISNLSVAESN